MPLKKSASKEAVKENISKMVKEGKPIKQAVAAAKDTQRKAAGNVTSKPSMPAKGSKAPAKK